LKYYLQKLWCLKQFVPEKPLVIDLFSNVPEPSSIPEENVIAEEHISTVKLS
jgi:hypothetical protein